MTTKSIEPSSRRYTSVKIPKQLAKQIQDVMVERGFRSVSDFVLFGTRQLLRTDQ